ncbi:hypothetical protein GCM10018952_71990 [Streptosporangium vulgare]
MQLVLVGGIGTARVDPHRADCRGVTQVEPAAERGPRLRQGQVRARRPSEVGTNAVTYTSPATSSGASSATRVATVPPMLCAATIGGAANRRNPATTSAATSSRLRPASGDTSVRSAATSLVR